MCAFSLAAYAMMRLFYVKNHGLQTIFLSDLGCGTARHPWTERYTSTNISKRRSLLAVSSLTSTLSYPVPPA
jgi:hypothetical protein